MLNTKYEKEDYVFNISVFGALKLPLQPEFIFDSNSLNNLGRTSRQEYYCRVS